MIRTVVPLHASLGPSRIHPSAIVDYLEDKLSCPVTRGPSLDWAGRSYERSQPRRSSMARRVLVLSNEDLSDANEVPPAIRPLIDEAEEIYVVAPTLTTWMQWLTDDRDNARVSARPWRAPRPPSPSRALASP